MRKRFVGPDGGFLPSVEPAPGMISINYLEELCEWIFYHDDMTPEEKLGHIKSMESIVDEIAAPVKVKHQWSVRLEQNK